MKRIRKGNTMKPINLIQFRGDISESSLNFEGLKDECERMCSQFS